MNYDEFQIEEFKKERARDPNVKEHRYPPIEFANPKNARVLFSDVPLKGIKYYFETFKKFCQRSNDPAQVFFNPNNIADKNAIVFKNSKGETLGHVPRDLAKALIDFKYKPLYVYPRHKYIDYGRQGFYYDIIQVDNPDLLTDIEVYSLWPIKQLRKNFAKILGQYLWRILKFVFNNCFAVLTTLLISFLLLVALVLYLMGYM